MRLRRDTQGGRLAAAGALQREDSTILNQARNRSRLSGFVVLRICYHFAVESGRTRFSISSISMAAPPQNGSSDRSRNAQGQCLQHLGLDGCLISFLHCGDSAADLRKQCFSVWFQSPLRGEYDRFLSDALLCASGASLLVLARELSVLLSSHLWALQRLIEVIRAERVDNFDVEGDAFSTAVGAYATVDHDICWSPQIHEDAFLIEHTSFLELRPEVSAATESKQ